MKTLKLYKEDVNLKQCTSTLLSCYEKENALFMIFNETVFAAEGGGQSSDIGTIEINGEIYEIIDVQESEDVSIHIAKYNPKLPPVPSTAIMRINWEHRFDNMQRHCAEHILSGIIHRKYQGMNKGFHMGKDYVAIDITFEHSKNYDTLTTDMINAIELEANQIIWENIPVNTLYFDSKEEASKCPVRKEVNVDNNISIVTIGNLDTPADCVACCGTHPTTTGQVGIIKIFKFEKNKGMFRIYFEAGRKAFADYTLKHNIISTLGNKYSSPTSEILSAIETEENKSKHLKNELVKIKQSIIKSYAIEIDQCLNVMNSTNDTSLLVREYNNLTVDELLNIGKFISEEIPKLIILKSSNQKAAVLLSNGITCDCGKLVKENAPIYQGKGGGKAANARALFPSAEFLDIFIDLIEKHLR